MFSHALKKKDWLTSEGIKNTYDHKFVKILKMQLCDEMLMDMQLKKEYITIKFYLESKIYDPKLSRYNDNL